jgi:hypothetical protein
MSVVSGIVGADAAGDAADTQASAANAAAAMQLEVAKLAIASQEKMFERGVELTDPWRTAGKNALATLQGKISAGPGDYTKSPGYDFRLAEGQKAMERSAAARGGLLSGAAGKAMERYGQDYATQDYDNYLRRYYESLTPLQSLAGVGQSTASQTAGAAGSLGAGIANTQMQAGNAAAAGILGAGQANAAGQINQANAITGSLQSGMNNALLGYDLWKKWQAPAAAAGIASAAAPTAADIGATYFMGGV